MGNLIGFHWHAFAKTRRRSLAHFKERLEAVKNNTLLDAKSKQQTIEAYEEMIEHAEQDIKKALRIMKGEGISCTHTKP